MLCRAFPGRLPSELLAEDRRLPAGLLNEVIEIQAYVQAYEMTEAADSAEARKRLPKTPLFDLVNELEFALAEEDRQQTHHGPAPDNANGHA